MSLDVSRMLIPGLSTLCAAGAVMVGAAIRTPHPTPTEAREIDAQTMPPSPLVIDELIPSMKDVVAKHLFVPERVATGENAFPDLVVKGVYVGTERSAVFSLKSRPSVNLRVWQGDEEAALALVEEDSDPRKPITDFLEEWQIRAVTFHGVTVEHLITGEVETYSVHYSPEKHVKDSAQSGYGQGLLPVTPATTARPPAASAAAASKAKAARPASTQSPQAVAGRVNAYVQKLTPQQRAAVIQQLNKQAAANKGGKRPENGSSANSKRGRNGTRK